MWSGVRSRTATTTASIEGARTLAIISASTRTAPNVSGTAMANIVKVSVKGTQKASESTQPRGDGSGKTEKEIRTEEGCFRRPFSLLAGGFYKKAKESLCIVKSPSYE